MLQLIQNSTPPITDVNSLLAWIVATLIAVIIFLFAYFNNQIKKKIADADIDRTYIRQQDKENIKLISDTNNVLDQVVKILDKNADKIDETLRGSQEVLTIIKGNESRLENIKDRLQNKD